jgi:hypothetical protein
MGEQISRLTLCGDLQRKGIPTPREIQPNGIVNELHR